MSLIKKLKRKKVTLGDIASKIVVIDELKKKGLLHTTKHGAFYTYPEVIRTDAAIKMMYIYARLTKLINPGDPLHFYHADDNELLAKYAE